MSTLRHPPLRLLLPLLLAGCAAAPPSREDILVLRSVREMRTETADWCTVGRTGFASPAGGFMWEDRFSMWAVRTDAADGHVVEALTERAGELRTCLAPTADPRLLAFYAEGLLAGVAVSGRGDCRVLARDTPEKGYTPVSCQLALQAAGYASGQLVSHTLSTPVILGAATDPPGYTQVSIATIRLWRGGAR